MFQCWDTYNTAKQKRTSKRMYSSFWKRHPDLTPLRGTGACLCMPVAGIRLRRTSSRLGVTPNKTKEHPNEMFFCFGGATRT